MPRCSQNNSDEKSERERDGSWSLTAVVIVLGRFTRKVDRTWERNLSSQSDTLKEENGMEDFPDEFSEMSIYERSKSLAIPEDVEDPRCEPVHERDLVDSSFHSLVQGSRVKYPSLAPPVAPRRSRQNSACSTQSSVRYASYVSSLLFGSRLSSLVKGFILQRQWFRLDDDAWSNRSVFVFDESKDSSSGSPLTPPTVSSFH